VIDYSGLETCRNNNWQRQLHLFEVPFYYIEYGIAQLGAIGMWMQYKENKEQAMDNYCNALALGGTRTLPQLFETAGLKFDFSPDKIKVLMEDIEHHVKEEEQEMFPMVRDQIEKAKLEELGAKMSAEKAAQAGGKSKAVAR